MSHRVHYTSVHLTSTRVYLSSLTIASTCCSFASTKVHFTLSVHPMSTCAHYSPFDRCVDPMSIRLQYIRASTSNPHVSHRDHYLRASTLRLPVSTEGHSPLHPPLVHPRPLRFIPLSCASTYVSTEVHSICVCVLPVSIGVHLSLLYLHMRLPNVDDPRLYLCGITKTFFSLPCCVVAAGLSC